MELRDSQLTNNDFEKILAFIKKEAHRRAANQEEYERLYDEGVDSLLNRSIGKLPESMWWRRIRWDIAGVKRRRYAVRCRDLKRLDLQDRDLAVTFPDEVESADFIKELTGYFNFRHRVMILMLLAGHTRKEISDKLGKSESRVCQEMKVIERRIKKFWGRLS